MFITNYACKKSIRKESHHLFSIVQEDVETIEAYIKRFEMEKMEISQCRNSKAIEAFYKGIKRDTSLFIKLKKTTPRSMEVVYEETHKFINIEKETKSIKEVVT